MPPDKFKFRDFFIPGYMHDSIEEYVQLGVKPGDFLCAVISNNLKEAVMYADDINLSNLPAYVNYFYNYAPLECWGSRIEMERWIKKGGLIGVREKLKKRNLESYVKDAHL